MLNSRGSQTLTLHGAVNIFIILFPTLGLNHELSQDSNLQSCDIHVIFLRCPGTTAQSLRTKSLQKTDTIRA